MPSETLNLETRIKTLNTVLTEKHDRQNVDEALRMAKGNIASIQKNLNARQRKRAAKNTLAHSQTVFGT